MVKMKKKDIILYSLWMSVLPVGAQSNYTRMIVHNGADSLSLRISRVDSITFDCGDNYSDLSTINWGSKIVGDAFFESFNFDNLSTYTHPTALPYYDFYIDGNTLYAVTTTGVRKIDYSDKFKPKLLKEHTPFVTNTNLQGRSIVRKGNNLYVGYRTSYKIYRQDDAQVTERFEKKVSNSEIVNNKLSNNPTVNSFFKKISFQSRDLSKVHQLFIFKAYKRSSSSYSNVILFKVSGGKDLSIFSKNYASREEALAALKDRYENSAGDYCEVDWNAVPEGNNTFSDVKFNFVSKSNYIHTANADYSISEVHCPNSGNHSGKFTVNTTTGDKAIINHQLNNSTQRGEISFWVRIDDIFTGDVQIPLFCNGSASIYSLTLSPAGNSFAMSIDKGTGLKSFSNGVWYNIKATYENGRKKLYYRSKECSDWILMGTTANDATNITNITIGVSATKAKANIYIDDFRYSSFDIDAVSYDKGKITVIDKNTLEPKKIINVEYPVTGMATQGNRLVVAGLDGVNVYNIADADNPELVYSYRPSEFRDIQNLKIYEHNGRVYAFICKYTRGVLILDITDLDNVFIAKEDEFEGWKYKNLSNAIYCYDVVIDYPYAYATIAPHPSYVSKIPEACGILSMNISDLNNITKTLFLMNSSDITSNKKGDISPTRIARYGNTLFVNNRDRGLAAYNIKEKGVLEYKGLVEFNNATSINCINITDAGYIFLGDDTTNGTYRNINCWRIKE